VGLRAPGIRVEQRGAQLVVRSGPPLLVAVVVAGLPLLMFLRVQWARRWETASAVVLLWCLFIAAAAWLVAGPWSLTLDRDRGLAKLRRGPWRARRPLAAFVGVRFFSMRQREIERIRRRQTVMPYAPVADLGCGVALVDAEGRWWRVTRADDRNGRRPRREDAEKAARLVASYLGLPFLPPYETPPGGAVPPPLEEGAVQQPR
jgi:hypothetical protein